MSYFDGDVRELGPVDPEAVDRLEAAVRELGAVWAEQDRIKPNRFACFEGTAQHIIFQFPLSLADHGRSVNFPLYREWAPLFEPVIAEATASYGFRQGKTGRIMLAKLLAGADVAPHTDKGPSCEVPHKIHVPLITHPDVTFFVEDRPYHLARGVAYEVNNRVVHHVENPSPVDRVHLIFDYYEAAVPAQA